MRLIRVFATLAVAALIVTACGGAATTPAPATAAPATAAPTGGGGNAISIQNFLFNPAQLTTTGGAVTWTNLDDTAHTVVFDNTAIAPSQNITKGGTPFSVTFPGAGTYAYKCGIHPTMTGTVTVS